MVKSIRDPSSEESSATELSEIRPLEEPLKRRHEAVTRNERRRSRSPSEPPGSLQPSSEPTPSQAAADAQHRAGASSEDRRELRVAQKAARAQALFRFLPPDDPRARLLKVALLRNDEVLIDALLRRLDSVPPRAGEP